MLISIQTHITFDCVATQTEENFHCIHYGGLYRGFRDTGYLPFYFPG